MLSPPALAEDGDATDTEGAVAETSLPDVATTDDGSGVVDDATIRKQLRSVENDVGSLRERAFRSLATLKLLRELVIEGAALGSRVRITHVNKMGPSYQMESVQYFLDGRNVYNRVDPEGSLSSSAMREFEVHTQSLPPGTHTLTVNMVLRGNGLGVFSYLKAYSFKVSSRYEFEIGDGAESLIRVIADEKGGPLVDYTRRPYVKYEEDQNPLGEE